MLSRGLKRFLYPIKEDRSWKGVERWAQKCNLRVKWHRASILIEGAGRRALALIQSLFQLFKNRSHYSTRWMPGHESHYTVNRLYSWHLCGSEHSSLLPSTLHLLPRFTVLPTVTIYRLQTRGSLQITSTPLRLVNSSLIGCVVPYFVVHTPLASLCRGTDTGFGSFLLLFSQ